MLVNGLPRTGQRAQGIGTRGRGSQVRKGTLCSSGRGPHCSEPQEKGVRRPSPADAGKTNTLVSSFLFTSKIPREAKTTKTRTSAKSDLPYRHALCPAVCGWTSAPPCWHPLRVGPSSPHSADAGTETQSHMARAGGGVEPGSKSRVSAPDARLSHRPSPTRLPAHPGCWR